MFFCATAQQATQYSLSMFNPYGSNSSYAGFDGTLSMHAAYRSQWNGLEGSPESQYVMAHLPVYRLHGAVGISLETESLGVERNLKMELSYNYVQELKIGYLSLGAHAGYFQKSVDGSLLRARDGIYRDGVFTHNDPGLQESKVSDGTPYMGLAVYYIHPLLEGGIQWSNLLASSLNSNESNIAIDYLSDMQIFAMGNYSLNEEFTIHPSLLMKTDFVQWQTDIAAWVDYRDMYGLGVSYRGISGPNADAIVLMAYLRLSEVWTVAYAYDLGISDLSAVHDGSHEIILRYKIHRRIGEAKRIPIIHNPRLLD